MSAGIAAEAEQRFRIDPGAAEPEGIEPIKRVAHYPGPGGIKVVQQEVRGIASEVFKGEEVVEGLLHHRGVEKQIGIQSVNASDNKPVRGEVGTKNEPHLGG